MCVTSIPDPDAVRPEEWDDRKTIEDPTAEKPADWSDEDDGDWERPEIPNPDYQGEWAAPQHPNPAYKGEWAPRKIPNPGYFEDSHPHNFNLIDGIGIELWTMSEGVSFNNILITYDEKIAEVFAEQTWRPRFEEERKIAAKNAPVRAIYRQLRRGFIVLTTYVSPQAPDSEIMKVLRKGLEVAKEYIDLAIVFANEQPIAFAASVAAGFIPVIVAVYFCGIGSSPAPKKKAPKKKPVAPEEKPLIGSEKIEELPEEETTTLRKRKN
jgi:calnexin